MKEKISIPKGTRDFTPVEMQRRSYIFDTIKKVFELYGYSQIETPSMENLSTLMGKYGEEGDKLIFKILNSGNFIDGIDGETMKDYKKLSIAICEKALRYDLTVPFARYVVMHQNEIVFPFKRYQIQPVWRADKPQKGRYREFYQCDIDIIGSESLLNEVELLCVIDEVFKRLGISVTIKINNRKILTALSKIIEEEDKLVEITSTIDKIDKIGIDGVIEELKKMGINNSKIDIINDIISLSGDNKLILKKLKEIFINSEIGMQGIEELETIIDDVNKLISTRLEVSISLARGLNYYTGTIIEVKSNDVMIGSICGGGRYDNLTGIFGLPNLSGVGISFGADRIYDVLMELNKFPDNIGNTTDVLILNFPEQKNYLLYIYKKLISNNIRTEIYPSNVKIKKQMEYANRKNIKYVLIYGEEEKNKNIIVIKDMHTGMQTEINEDKLLEFIKTK